MVSQDMLTLFRSRVSNNEKSQIRGASFNSNRSSQHQNHNQSDHSFEADQNSSQKMPLEAK